MQCIIFLACCFKHVTGLFVSRLRFPLLHRGHRCTPGEQTRQAPRYYKQLRICASGACSLALAMRTPVSGRAQENLTTVPLGRCAFETACPASACPWPVPRPEAWVAVAQPLYIRVDGAGGASLQRKCGKLAQRYSCGCQRSESGGKCGFCDAAHKHESPLFCENRTLPHA
jgi:hypothetical protein